jgi:hypothetical protein
MEEVLSLSPLKRHNNSEPLHHASLSHNLALGKYHVYEAKYK